MIDPAAWDVIVAKHGIPSAHADCNSGWHAILDEMLARLKAAGFKGNVGEIKEKSGGLRVFLEGYDPNATDEEIAVLDRCHTIARETEAASYRVCEVCGAPGGLYGDSYWNYRVACEEHRR